MIINLSKYFYNNKFIPISIDSTAVKIAKISSLIFLRFFSFFLDCTYKLLAHRSITQEKKSSDPFTLVKKTLNNTEKIIEKTSTEIYTDKYSVHLAIQRNALEKCLKETFQVTPENFLKNLKLFIAKEYIDFKFIPIFINDPILIHKYLVKTIEILFEKYPNDKLSNYYKEHAYALRNGISTKEYKINKYQNIALIIQELCFAKFVYIILTDLEEEILKSTIGFDSSKNRTASNISKLIEKDNKILRKQPKTVRHSILLNCEKACNAAGISSDQLCSANIPELRSIHTVKQGTKLYDIYYIRYPTPTIETAQSFYNRVIGDNATIIAPEFMGFLDSIQRKEIPFLHVNHQYMDKKKNNDHLLSADHNRAEAIQRLEEVYTEVFHFLSLPFDGPVINEIDIESLTKWKQNLVSNLIGEKKGFRIPKKFRKSATCKQQVIEQLLDNLYNLYFPGKLELNEIERRVLLVIFYSYLKEYFKSEYQIRIMASVCKDNKDRGNVSACIDEALFNLRLGKENDPQALKDLHLRILSPFIFRNEGIVEHRLKFLIDLLDHIAKLDDTQKKSIREFQVNEQYQIVNQRVPRFNDSIMI